MAILSEWWSSQTPFLQFYYLVAIASFAALIIQSVLLLAGLHSDTGFDFSEHSEGLGVVSVRTITAFLVGFGWTGVIVLESGGGVPLAVVLSVAAGALLMYAAHVVFKKLLQLQTKGNVDYANSIGQIGTVYLTIQPQTRDGGQVELIVQGRLRFIKAITQQNEPIPPGTKVRVVSKIDNETLLVECLTPSM